MAAIFYDAAHTGAARRTRRAGAPLSAVIGLVLAGLGLGVLFGLPWGQATTSLSARFWPVADARILSVSLDEVHAPGAHGVTAALALSVEYRFEATGETFTGRAASLADRTEAQDRRLVSLFRRIEFSRITGRAMPAVYDPADPSRAFLDAALPWKDFLPGLGLGAVLLLAAAHFLARAAGRGNRS